jgi:hypothetical protein
LGLFRELFLLAAEMLLSRLGGFARGDFDLNPIGNALARDRLLAFLVRRRRVILLLKLVLPHQTKQTVSQRCLVTTQQNKSVLRIVAEAPRDHLRG